MKFLRTIIPILVVVGFASTSLYARGPEKDFEDNVCDKGDLHRHDNQLSERDWEELYDFINTKRQWTVDDKGCKLTISGDVRADWRHTNEKGYILEDGKSVHLRGSNRSDDNGVRVSRNDFDVEFNLYFDYCSDKAWAVAWVQFDNTAGVEFNDHKKDDKKGFHGSGFCCDLCLKKAYVGYNICCNGDTRFDVEVGRRHLYHVFDSEVQFLSRFDGLLLKYCSSWDCVADWYAYLGGFVIDERSNHFGWVTEIGLLNIYDCGFDLKYSFIDWTKRGENRYSKRDPVGHKFKVSQFTGYYHFTPDYLCMPAKIYGAFIWNHDADNFKSRNVSVKEKEGESTVEKKAKIDRDKRYAWYAGFRIGEVCKCGDWAFDAQYQYVQAQAVPDRDVSGIGRGNWFDERLTKTGRGNTNYKGWRVEALYALTNNLTIDATFEASREIDKEIGDTHRYSQFQLETIYAF